VVCPRLKSGVVRFPQNLEASSEFGHQSPACVPFATPHGVDGQVSETNFTLQVKFAEKQKAQKV